MIALVRYIYMSCLTGKAKRNHNSLLTEEKNT